MGSYIRREWLGFAKIEEEYGVSKKRVLLALQVQGYLEATPNTDDGFLPKCQFTITGKGVAEGWLTYFWPPYPNDRLLYEAFVTLDVHNPRCREFLKALAPQEQAA